MSSQGSMYTKVQYGAESSAYGTETGSYTEAIRVQSINIESDNGFIHDIGIGEGLNASNTYYGPFDSSGSINLNLTDFDLLKHWIGPKSGAGTVGDPWILTEAEYLSTSSSNLQPFSIEVKNDDAEDSISANVGLGCTGSSFGLTCDIGERLKFNGDFVAQKSGFRSTGETYVPNTESSFIMINGTFKYGTSPVALPGIQSLSLNYDNKLVLDTREIDNRFLGIPKLGAPREYKGSVSIKMNNALKTTIINGFYGNLTTGLYTPNIADVSPTDSVEFEVTLYSKTKVCVIQLDNVVIDKLVNSVSLGGGLVLLSFEFTARESKGNEFVKWWAV